MPKWRVTFEVDLGDLIPAPEALEPHDHPLPVWASQTIFEMIFKQGSVSALREKMDYILRPNDDPGKQPMLDYLQRKHELCEEAARTSKVELIED